MKKQSKTRRILTDAIEKLNQSMLEKFVALVLSMTLHRLNQQPSTDALHCAERNQS